MITDSGIFCDWCSDPITSIRMLHMDTWRQISNNRVDDIMCIPCIINKLGHEPTEHERRQPWWPCDAAMKFGAR